MNLETLNKVIPLGERANRLWKFTVECKEIQAIVDPTTERKNFYVKPFMENLFSRLRCLRGGIRDTTPESSLANYLNTEEWGQLLQVAQSLVDRCDKIISGWGQTNVDGLARLLTTTYEAKNIARDREYFAWLVSQINMRTIEDSRNSVFHCVGEFNHATRDMEDTERCLLFNLMSNLIIRITNEQKIIKSQIEELLAQEAVMTSKGEGSA